MGGARPVGAAVGCWMDPRGLPPPTSWAQSSKTAWSLGGQRRRSADRAGSWNGARRDPASRPCEAPSHVGSGPGQRPPAHPDRWQEVRPSGSTRVTCTRGARPDEATEPETPSAYGAEWRCGAARQASHSGHQSGSGRRPVTSRRQCSSQAGIGGRTLEEPSWRRTEFPRALVRPRAASSPQITHGSRSVTPPHPIRSQRPEQPSDLGPGPPRANDRRGLADPAHRANDRSRPEPTCSTPTHPAELSKTISPSAAFSVGLTGFEPPTS